MLAVDDARYVHSVAHLPYFDLVSLCPCSSSSATSKEEFISADIAQRCRHLKKGSKSNNSHSQFSQTLVSTIIACKSKRSSSAGGSESVQGALYDSKHHHKRAYSKGPSKSSRHHLAKKGKDNADDDMANVMAAHVFNRGMDQKHKQEQEDEQSTSMDESELNGPELSIVTSSKLSNPSRDSLDLDIGGNSEVRPGSLQDLFTAVGEPGEPGWCTMVGNEGIPYYYLMGL